MKFSIVIPTYGREALVHEAVRTVLAQTFQDFEVIVVDDGSPQPIRLSLADDRVRVLRHQTNRGPSAARNTGIAAARGELVAFLDSDDLWFPRKLELQAALMEDAACGACVTGFDYDTEEGFTVEIPRRPRSWLRELALGCRLSPGSTLVVRRACYETVGGYDERFPRHEDLDWLLRFVQRFDLCVVGESLASVRRGGQPAAEPMEAANLLILQRHGAVFRSFGRFFGSRAIGKRLLEIAVQFARDGKKPQARAYLLRAVSANPFQRPVMYLRVVDGLLGTRAVPALKRFVLRRPR